VSEPIERPRASEPLDLEAEREPLNVQAESEPLNIDELETRARARLEKSVYDYVAGGAEDEVTVASNREAFRKIALRYRVLVDVSAVDLGVDLLGLRLRSPVVLAPTALHRLAHPDGEAAAARASAAAGTLMVLSTISSLTLEEVAAAAPRGHRWFQLYCFERREDTEALVARAHRAGYSALVLTVDLPLLGRRERDLRNGFAVPEESRPAHPPSVPVAAVGRWPLSSIVGRPSLSWKDLAWIRDASPLPLVVKGIVRGDDAARALDSGAAAIWVSNHGGRQLDGAVATATALPEIVGAVRGRAPVIVDGGVRRGTDVLKALALGAAAVAIGRPQIWGLAADGEAGVRRVLEMLESELELAMALCGCRSIGEIDSSLVRA
jgi:isopentenyl diphosphate isomerase/L-lactate dehydrogenase-like FMN-dependent dehydrogenase